MEVEAQVLFEVPDKGRVVILGGDYEDCRDAADYYHTQYQGNVFIKTFGKSTHLYKVKEKVKKGHYKDGIALTQIY